VLVHFGPKLGNKTHEKKTGRIHVNDVAQLKTYLKAGSRKKKTRKEKNLREVCACMGENQGGRKQ
jgi:hypothetical protein